MGYYLCYKVNGGERGGGTETEQSKSYYRQYIDNIHGINILFYDYHFMFFSFYYVVCVHAFKLSIVEGSQQVHIYT